MMILTGRGGEGKSRIGLVVKKLMGDSVHMESITGWRPTALPAPTWNTNW